jgi:hypothetical protein
MMEYEFVKEGGELLAHDTWVYKSAHHFLLLSKINISKL